LTDIFTPSRIKELEIKNRIVLPPMVAFTFAQEGGFVSEENINHYEQMAKGGAGLIIVEATCVNHKGKLSKDQLEIWDDKYIDGLSKIVKVCHENDSKVFIQLHHAGLRTSKDVTEDMVSSWDYDDGKRTARALAIEEIHKIQEDFVNAAVKAEKAGFDGIELHGAHGYLMTQFFSLKVNKRTDKYGGSLGNRMRIALEIIEKIKSKVRPDFVIGIRMGSNENSLEASIEMAKEFEKYVNYLHISTGFDNTPLDVELPDDFPCNWIVYGGTKIKENVDIPVVVVNSIKTKEQIEYLLANDLADFVAVGRSQLADPSFVNHIKNQEEINKCINCRPCKWYRDGRKCPARVR